MDVKNPKGFPLSARQFGPVGLSASVEEKTRDFAIFEP